MITTFPALLMLSKDYSTIPTNDIPLPLILVFILSLGLLVFLYPTKFAYFEGSDLRRVK